MGGAWVCGGGGEPICAYGLARARACVRMSMCRSPLRFVDYDWVSRRHSSPTVADHKSDASSNCNWVSDRRWERVWTTWRRKRTATVRSETSSLLPSFFFLSFLFSGFRQSILYGSKEGPRGVKRWKDEGETDKESTNCRKAFFYRTRSNSVSSQPGGEWSVRTRGGERGRLVILPRGLRQHLCPRPCQSRT